MASDVVMPRLSDSMEEGTVLKWLVDVGGEVKRGEPLVEIETDKANMVHNADADGTLLEVVAAEGETLEVGSLIARVGEPGEQTPDVRPRTSEPEQSPETPPPPPPSGNGGERVKASPVARRVAGERGIDLSTITGSGPGGRIVRADVEGGEAGPGASAKTLTARSEPIAEPEAGPVSGPKGSPEVRELSRLQRTVSRRMAESKATAPEFSLTLDVDMTLCIELRGRLKEQSDPAPSVGEERSPGAGRASTVPTPSVGEERSPGAGRASTVPTPSYNDMIVKASALALREHPKVNGAYRDGAFELYPRVNVGVAVAAQDALVVPVVPDADQKSLGEIARQARRLIERVRSGEITPPELSGATFTVSNLGMFGIERFEAILNPPQAAILSVGALMKKATVDEHGRVVARDLMTLTLVCDHRILYGADGAEFLARVRELLEQPLSLAL